MLVSVAKRSTLATLLPVLEKADRGSARLDLLIGYLVDAASPDDLRRIELFREDGYLPDRIAELTGFVPMPYTTSLDAALPGENIVLAMYSAARGRWAAIHRRSDGEEDMAWGATEALARRAAALRAIAVANKVALPRAADRPAGLVAGTAAVANEVPDDSWPDDANDPAPLEGEAEPWKILF